MTAVKIVFVTRSNVIQQSQRPSRSLGDPELHYLATCTSASDLKNKRNSPGATILRLSIFTLKSHMIRNDFANLFRENNKI